MIKSSKSGFTLAEVLTTLMVIGVVAAMTIPTLMNSTQNQQAQVAAKKAASVLAQATQLFVARDESCVIGDSDDKNAKLASCFSRVISGSLNGNTINTADGMIYSFYANREGNDLIEICGNNIVSYSGAGNCAVIVDTNGAAKGSTDYEAPTSFTSAGFKKDDLEKDGGTDIIGFSLSASSARPLAFEGGANKGYGFIIGDSPSSYTVKGCYPKDKELANCPEGKDTTYQFVEGLTYTTGECSSSQNSIDDATKVVDSEDLCPPASN